MCCGGKRFEGLEDIGTSIRSLVFHFFVCSRIVVFISPFIVDPYFFSFTDLHSVHSTILQLCFYCQPRRKRLTVRILETMFAELGGFGPWPV